MSGREDIPPATPPAVGTDDASDHLGSPLPPPPPFNTPIVSSFPAASGLPALDTNGVTGASLVHKLSGLRVNDGRDGGLYDDEGTQGDDEGGEKGVENVGNDNEDLDAVVLQASLIAGGVVDLEKGEEEEEVEEEEEEVDGGLEEEEEEEEEEEDDDDEDLEDDEVSLPPEVMKRLYTLKALQEERDAVYEAYCSERIAMETRFSGLYAEIFRRRADIVSGVTDVTDEAALAEVETDASVGATSAAAASAVEKEPGAGVEMGAGSAKGDAAEGSEALAKGPLETGGVKGVPHFWMQSMLHHEALHDIVCESDLEALFYLTDIRCKEKEDLLGFELEFYFAQNPFFYDKVLTKSYDTANIMDQGEPLLEKVTGCKVSWKPGRSLCERVFRKKARKGRGGEVRMVRHVEKMESFFKFFQDPIYRAEEEEEEDEEEPYNFFLEMDYEIALIFRNHLIPNAVLWFTGEAAGDDDEDDDEEEDELLEDGIVSRREEQEGRGKDGLGAAQEKSDDLPKFLSFQAPEGIEGAASATLAGIDGQK